MLNDDALGWKILSHWSLGQRTQSESYQKRRKKKTLASHLLEPGWRAQQCTLPLDLFLEPGQRTQKEMQDKINAMYLRSLGGVPKDTLRFYYFLEPGQRTQRAVYFKEKNFFKM